MTTDIHHSIAAPTRDNTALVVVTFQPDEGFRQRLDVAARQFPAVFVVDNTGREAPEPAEPDSKELRAIRNQRNLGLATALNQGCDAALAAGFAWVVTLDQDSLLEHQFLAGMVRAWCESGEQPAVLGCNYFSVSRGVYKIDPDQAATSRSLKTVITSGCLTHLHSWRELGKFREDFFIDSIDHEFCLRARRAGLRVRISCEPGMQHTIGSELAYKFGLNRLAPFSHSSLRKYTSSRNSLRTVLEFAGQEPLWCLRKLLGLTAEFLSIVVLERGKGRRLQCFLLGLKHGWQGKMGPPPESVQHE